MTVATKDPSLSPPFAASFVRLRSARFFDAAK